MLSLRFSTSTSSFISSFSPMIPVTILWKKDFFGTVFTAFSSFYWLVSVARLTLTTMLFWEARGSTLSAGSVLWLISSSKNFMFQADDLDDPLPEAFLLSLISESGVFLDVIVKETLEVPLDDLSKIPSVLHLGALNLSSSTYNRILK